jgi:hypothetical protein
MDSKNSSILKLVGAQATEQTEQGTVSVKPSELIKDETTTCYNAADIT